MIKLTLWQRFLKWLRRPFWENYTIELCDKYCSKILAIPLEKRKEFWKLIMNNTRISIYVRYELEKNHRYHFIGEKE